MSFNDASNTCSTKTSVKWLEAPIQKFNAAVAHFVDMLKGHHKNINKLRRLNQWNDLKKEHESASRIVKQLSFLLYEIENLRNQVVDVDLKKFDKLIKSSRQTALILIQSHRDISIQIDTAQYNSYQKLKTEVVNTEVQDQQLQIIANITEDINRQEQCVTAMERLQDDVEDIHSLFEDISQLVHQQEESVNKIEEYVEITHHNVLEGESMLCQAAKYKNSMYPLLGALIGTVVGGPVGLVAGLKLGGLTAVGGGFLGFTGGKFLKNQGEDTISEANQYREHMKS